MPEKLALHTRWKITRQTFKVYECINKDGIVNHKRRIKPVVVNVVVVWKKFTPLGKY
jgi:hypothetical protein